MSNIIDITYFKREILISQVAQAAVADAVNASIAAYEPEYILNVLGYGLSRDFIAGIAAGSPAQKWVDLRDGKEFIDPNTNRLIKWSGFKNVMLSPIAYYVYFMYRKNNVTETASVGEVISQTDNSVVVSPGRKTSFAWNRMVELNILLWNYLFVNMADYGLTTADFGRSCNLQNFPLDADFTMICTINDFDI